MKVSLITTIKNEEKTIKKFLDSLYSQTKKPDEVIIVDGGSEDATLEEIKRYKLKIKNLKVVVRKGNRSVGRNIAIRNSVNNIIVCTDAGCFLDKNWLERITKPFADKNVDVVAGFYKPVANSIFEKCLAAYTCVMPDRLDQNNFLPSSRSIAFKKSAWKKVGGYPENLDTCEDLVFAREMKKAGMRFKTVKNAIVHWPQRKNILAAAIQFFNYAKGDGKAGYIRRSTPFLFGRYIFGILFLTYIIFTRSYNLIPIIYTFLFLYVIWAIWKNYRYVKEWRALFYLPVLQFVSDVMVILGTSIGFVKRIAI